MSWLHPTLLIALIAIPLAAALFAWAALRRRQALQRFGDHPLVQKLAGSVSARRRRWKAAVTVLAVGLLALALAGPRYGTKLREVQREGIDLLILLDVSDSMRAEDVAPNRLMKAKQEISNLLDALTGDRVGLILFAGDAFLQCPFTLDYNAVRLFLEVASPEAIPTPGTDFERALDVAVRALEPDENPAGPPGQRRTAALLIVSDGENQTTAPDTYLNTLKERGIPVFAAGIGSTEGAPLPHFQNGQRIGFKRDVDGQLVQSRLEEDLLRRMAGDRYVRIARTGTTLPRLKPALDRLERTAFGQDVFEEYQERYQWPLALALLLLIAERVWRVESVKRGTGNGERET